jgi:fucose permease
VLAGLLLAALAVVVVTFTSGAPLLAIVVLAGAGVGMVWTNSDALVSALAERNRLGVRIGAAQSFKELGDMLSPLLIGALT